MAGGAERLVVDAALGLQALGHSVDLYTSHHDPNHCFEETKDGSFWCIATDHPVLDHHSTGRLSVHNVTPPFPRSWKEKFHIVFAHLRQLHLTQHLLRPSAPRYDVYLVDQLSTCIPLLRLFARRRVVFYCHFPDKLLAHGEYVDGNSPSQRRRRKGLLKGMYRIPMDLLEEMTTSLFNQRFSTQAGK